MDYDAFIKSSAVVMEYYTSHLYSIGTIERVERALATIKEHIPLSVTFSIEKIVAKLIRDKSVPKDTKRVLFHIMAMLEMAAETGSTESRNINKNRKGKTILPKKFAELTSEYSAHLKKLYTNENTIAIAVMSSSNLLYYLFKSGIEDIAQLSTHHLDSYLNYGMKGLENATKKTRTCNIRKFLHYLFRKGYINADLGFYFNGVTFRVSEYCVSVLSKEQADAIVRSESTEENAALHCRNKAIALCALLLGLRISDILNLKLEDIEWKASVINIIQIKTNVYLSIPFPEIVGYELAKYINKYRPCSKDSYIFRTISAPFNRLTSVASVRIKRLVPEDEGTLPAGGYHLLRRTCASNLLTEGTDIATIANILGHSSLDTLNKYLNIEEEKMSAVPILHSVFELPEVLR